MDALIPLYVIFPPLWWLQLVTLLMIKVFFSAVTLASVAH